MAGTTGDADGRSEREPIDEDTFVLPPAWQRALLPRRGRAGVRPFEPDPEQLAAADRLLEAVRDVLEESLAHPESDPALAAAGRAYLAGAATPLGAAVVAAVARARFGWRDERQIGALAHRWLAGHGVELSARAVVELATVTLGAESRPDEEPRRAVRIVRLRRLDPAEPRYDWFLESITAVAGPVRAALAAAPDEVYTAAVAALRAHRAADLNQRVLTSFLVPTETAWVTADCAAVTGGGTARSKPPRELVVLLLAAAGTAEHLTLLRHWHSFWAVPEPVFLSLVEGVGPALTGALLDRLDRGTGVEDRRRLLSVLARMPGDEAYRGLLKRAGGCDVAAALLEATGRFPRRAMRLLAAHAHHGLPADLVRGHVATRPDLVGEILPTVPPDAADRLRELGRQGARTPAAPAGALPAVLVTPPWTVRRPRRRADVVTGLTCTDGPAVRWLPGERDDWARQPESTPGRPDGRAVAWEDHAATVRSGHLDDAELLHFFLVAPAEVSRSVLSTWRFTPLWDTHAWRAVAARVELDALGALLTAAEHWPAAVAPALLPFTGPRIATLMADWYSRRKTLRRTALTWLTRHPAAAARALVPAAVGPAGAGRRAAGQALRAIAAHGHTAEIHRAAAGHGPRARAEVEGILSVDPLHLLPARMPVLPGWAGPVLLPPVRLRDGAGVLPPAAVGHLLSMLAVSRLDAPYAGLDEVRRACDAADLAEFVWQLFQRWRDFDAPGAHDWTLHALGLLGDDTTVRRLTPVIRAWPGAGGNARAETGLEVLAAIGTDLALLHLHGVAQTVPYRKVRDRAGRKLAELAAGLRLTAEQLADRLVPDLGFTGAGTLTLDYGPRRFTVGLDEQLRPTVADGSGRRLKALPRPGAADDAELAPAAYRRFAGLRRDVRTVAADQVRRFERAMVGGRRWPVADFDRYLVGHPVLRHLVQRLVWTVHDTGGAVTGAFRVAEDRTPADVRDEPAALPADARVGVAHPVHLGGDLAAWADLFADYAILQPFPQLGRGGYRLTDEERAAPRLDRFTGRTVPTGRLLGLESRGWRRAAPADGGVQNRMHRTGPDGHAVVVALDPGFRIGGHDPAAPQTLLDVSVGGRDPSGAGAVLGDLDPVTAYEVVRDLTEATR